MKVNIEEFPLYRIACKRFTGLPGGHKELEMIWQEILEWGKDKGIMENMHTEVIHGIGISHREPSGECSEAQEYYAGIIVDNEFSDEKDIEIREIGGGQHVVVKHTGSYSNIRETYNRVLNDWMPSSNMYPISNTYIEIFRTNPGQLSKGYSEVDICIPVLEE